MRLFFIIEFILNSLTIFCQVDLFFPLKNEFDWARIEKKNDELKKKFIEREPDELEYFYNIDDDDGFHIVDFNGDGLDDIVFQGYSMFTDIKHIIIFINIGESFVNIFDDYQEIYKMLFQNGKVHRLYIKDDGNGCCCNYIGTNKIYTVDYTYELPKINLINKMQYIDTSNYNEIKAMYPSKYFDKYIKFKVLKNNTIIRFSPLINDTTEFGYCGNFQNGNSLGKIKSGSIGYALAEQVDATGRVWWFVAISPNAEIYNSMYYSEKTKPNTYKMGWISSRFVKIIDEK